MALVKEDSSLMNETRCPFCLEKFLDVVSMECGHNICKGCMKWVQENQLFGCCPLCRETFSPLRRHTMNRVLLNIIKELQKPHTEQQTIKHDRIDRIIFLCENLEKEMESFMEENCVRCIRCEFFLNDFVQNSHLHEDSVNTEMTILQNQLAKAMDEIHSLQRTLDKSEHERCELMKLSQTYQKQLDQIKHAETLKEVHEILNENTLDYEIGNFRDKLSEPIRKKVTEEELLETKDPVLELGKVPMEDTNYSDVSNINGDVSYTYYKGSMHHWKHSSGLCRTHLWVHNCNQPINFRAQN
ncbi:nuclear factor 7, brain-like isoform X2 [Protopterus annectens]|uniref:nuclear factor 7, brain-like isoform X2 n=1 Tax=Protopterus annectens TaxID=7888 RepID=UPI001CFAA92C|nr:nuclear factor 7, brain-like isoform X2 [Protopterus annectens]